MEFSDRFAISPEKLANYENFKYLDDLIQNAEKEIVLNCNIVFDDDGYDEGIPIDADDLIIDGNGHFIDAKCNGRIFNIDGKNITIKNLKFKNGSGMMGGAAYVSLQSSCLIENSCFIKNRSFLGGAILNRGNLTLIDSKFSNNSSEEVAGAIKNDGKLTVEGCTFSNNSSKCHAGAIFNTEDLTLNGCVFSKNGIEYSGGAIYNFSGKIMLEGCTFNHNFAKRYGGAIDNWDGVLILNGCKLTKNSVKGDGGAILNSYGGAMKIEDSEIEFNLPNDVKDENPRRSKKIFEKFNF